MLFLISYFLKKSECSHQNISPHDSGKYCPDCGEIVEVSWYIIRCNCCNSKRKLYLKGSKILPVEHFCCNCGEKAFTLLKLQKPNYFDINYAVAVKEIVDSKIKHPTTQIWIEKEKKELIQKLIPLMGK